MQAPDALLPDRVTQGGMNPGGLSFPGYPLPRSVLRGHLIRFVQEGYATWKPHGLFRYNARLFYEKYLESSEIPNDHR